MIDLNVSNNRLRLLYAVIFVLGVIAVVRFYQTFQENDISKNNLDLSSRPEIPVNLGKYAGKIFPEINLTHYPDGSLHRISSLLSPPTNGLLLTILSEEKGCQPCNDLLAKRLLAVEEQLKDNKIKAALLLKNDNAAKVIRLIQSNYPSANFYLFPDSISVNQTFSKFPVMLFLLNDARIVMTHYPDINQPKKLEYFLNFVSTYKPDTKLVFDKTAVGKRNHDKILKSPFVLEEEIPLPDNVIISEVREIKISDDQEFFIIDRISSELFIFDHNGSLIEKISKEEVLDPGLPKRLSLVDVEPIANNKLFMVFRSQVDFLILYDRKIREAKKIFVKLENRKSHEIFRLIAVSENRLVALAAEPVQNVASKLCFLDNKGNIAKRINAFPELKYPRLSKKFINFERLVRDSRNNFYCMTPLGDMIHEYDRDGKLIRHHTLSSIKGGLVRPAEDFFLQVLDTPESLWENDLLINLFVLNNGYMIIGRYRKDKVFYDVFRLKVDSNIEYYKTLEGLTDSPLKAAKGDFLYGYRWPSLSSNQELKNIIITKYSFSP